MAAAILCVATLSKGMGVEKHRRTNRKRQCQAPCTHNQPQHTAPSQGWVPQNMGSAHKLQHHGGPHVEVNLVGNEAVD